MDPLSHETIVAKQRERILIRIEKANQLLDDYENIVLSSDNPREKLRADEGIIETEKLIEKYKSQLMALEQDKELLVNYNISQDSVPIGGKPPSNIDQKDKKQGDSSGKTSVDSVEDLDRKLDELKRGIDDLKDAQLDVFQLLNETRNRELRTIISTMLQRDAEQEDIKQILEVIQNAVSVLQENENQLSTQMQRIITEAGSILSNETSVQSKLELTLPIIPLILDYKVELEAANSVNLNKLLENTQNWWNSWRARASRNTWQSSTLIEYGNYIRVKNPTKDMEPEQAARQSLNQYYVNFQAKNDYLSEFETKINQSMANLNVLSRAHEELIGLAELSQVLVEELRYVNLSTDYPMNDLERITELAMSTAHQANSAAGLVVVNGSPTLQINQVRRNLPILRKTMRNLLWWFQQTVA